MAGLIFTNCDRNEVKEDWAVVKLDKVRLELVKTES